MSMYSIVQTPLPTIAYCAFHQPNRSVPADEYVKTMVELHQRIAQESIELNAARTKFLSEAVMLTAIGGVMGIILGTLLSLLTAFILSRFVGLNWHFTFPLQAALLGIGVSAATGLVFGLYPPARRPKKARLKRCGMNKKAPYTSMCRA